MIASVKILDNTNLPLQYASKLEAFTNGTEYQFNKRINVIIGANGCGKSTLIKMIAMLMLCDKSRCSQFSSTNLLKMSDLFYQSWDERQGLKDGIEIKADYMSVVYNYLSLKDLSNDDILSSAHIAAEYMNNTSASTGEATTSALGNLLEYAFSNKDVSFPLESLQKACEAANDYWQPNLKQLIDYYAKNRINISKRDFAYTFLLDEPDRNLDISHIDDLYKVLSYEKDYTQLICVIHNPILIYKLSKLEYINFIEMTPNYLDEIKKIFKNL